MLGNVVRTVTARVPSASRDTVVVVAYSDFDDEALDLEIGFSLKREIRKPIVLPGNVTMAMTELPAEAMLATVVRHGPNYESHLAIGCTWHVDGGERFSDRGAGPRSLSSTPKQSVREGGRRRGGAVSRDQGGVADGRHFNRRTQRIRTAVRPGSSPGMTALARSFNRDRRDRITQEGD